MENTQSNPDASAIPAADEQIEQTVTSSSPASSNADMLKLALKIFGLDLGLTVCFGFVLGFALGFISGGDMASFEEYFMIGGMFIGVLASLYASFLMYRKYSKATQGIVYLCVVAFIFSMMSLVSTEEISIQSELITIGVSILAIFMGWYVAMKTLLSIPLLGDRAVKVFAVIGYVVMFLSVLTLFTVAFQ